MTGSGEGGLELGRSASDPLLADLRRLAVEEAPIEVALRSIMSLIGVRRGPLLVTAEFFAAASDRLPPDEEAARALRLTRRLLAVPVFRC